MKRLLAAMCAAMIVVTLLLTVGVTGTSAEGGVKVGADVISDAAKRAYVNKMLAYHLSEKGEKRISEALANGKNAVFFFEGASDHALPGDPFYDVDRYRFGCVCIVVKMVGGKPEIVYTDDYSSTLPDNPRAADSRDDAVATLLDGVYPLVNCNHFGFAALHVPAYDWGTAVRCFRTGYYIDVCYGINIHSRGTDNITPTTNNSSGCLLVGKAPYWSESYNNFMYAVTGIEHARSNAFDKVALDYGCVIIDRVLYKEELLKIYDSGAGDQYAVVRALTAYSDGLHVPDPVQEESDAESSESVAESSEESVESVAESSEESAEESAEESVPERAQSAEDREESTSSAEPATERHLSDILLIASAVLTVVILILVLYRKYKK